MEEAMIEGARYRIRLNGRAPSYSHGFREGEEVISIRVDSGDANAWYFRSITDWNRKAWVNIKDLEELDPGPTEEEILKAFGISAPQPHCTTCTCY